MHVYVIERDESLVKIGFSTNPTKRIGGISSQGGFSLTRVWMSLPNQNSKIIERAAHKNFADFRGIGEWFSARFDDVVSNISMQFSNLISEKSTSNNISELDIKTITGRISYAMNIAGIKQIDIANHLNISCSAVSQWFSSSLTPKLDNLYPLADFLKVCPRWLATGTSEKSAAAILTPLTPSQRAQAILMLEAFAMSCAHDNDD
jgi:transcriptional regulator with XRE-family HTH domain